jgi:hypothetical protein
MYPQPYYDYDYDYEYDYADDYDSIHRHNIFYTQRVNEPDIWA